jgi:hypothetical protein
VLDPEDLTEGFGKLGASASFAQVSGRGLASGLVAVSGAARAVTADALSYAASVTCLLMVKGDEPRPEGKPAGNRRLRSDITQGLAFITRHPVLRKTIACAATGNLFIAMQISLNLLSGLLTWCESRCEVCGLEGPRTRLAYHIIPGHGLEYAATLHNYLASIFTASDRPGRKRFQ